MSALVAAFVVVLAVPLFFGSWRLALAGLGLQSLVVLAMMLGAAAHAPSAATAVTLVVDLALVRGLGGPLVLARAARGVAPPRFDTLPGDLFQWAVALLLVAAGGSFAWRLFPDDPARAVHVGTAAAEVLIGMFIVSQHPTALGQAIGMLTIENGAVLLEALLGYHWPTPVHLGLTAVFVGLVVLVASFLRQLPVLDASAAGDLAADEGEVL